MLFDVIHNRVDQVADTVESLAANPLVGDLAKPTFHQIQPRTARRDEVDMESRVPLEPRFDLGMLVGALTCEVQHSHSRGSQAIR